MRTTLDIDPDILQVAKELATRGKSTAGAVISQLARQGYEARSGAAGADRAKVRNGVEMFPKRGEPLTVAHVERIMEEEGI